MHDFQKNKTSSKLMIGLFKFFNFLFIYSHVHTLFGPFLLPTPYPLHLLPWKLLLPGRACSALISNFVEEKT
jgi:hypothetical protein